MPVEDHQDRMRRIIVTDRPSRRHCPGSLKKEEGMRVKAGKLGGSGPIICTAYWGKTALPLARMKRAQL